MRIGRLNLVGKRSIRIAMLRTLRLKALRSTLLLQALLILPLRRLMTTIPPTRPLRRLMSTLLTTLLLKTLMMTSLLALQSPPMSMKFLLTPPYQLGHRWPLEKCLSSTALTGRRPWGEPWVNPGVQLRCLLPRTLYMLPLIMPQNHLPMTPKLPSHRPKTLQPPRL